MANSFGGDDLVANWMRNRNTIEFLGVWEQVYNPNFNSVGFDGIKMQAGLNTFRPSPKKWVEETNAIGLFSKTGRYNSGVFAHQDIAMEFGTWLSPTFKIYLIKEFRRLKEEESDTKGLAWDLRRSLSKINYHIHSDAVKSFLIPPRLLNTKMEGSVYASEADLLNIALFGITARNWKLANPDAKGNMRDNASAEQLLVLANLENLNAEFIKQNLNANERLQRLNDIAIYQMELLVTISTKLVK
jgi:KilA-N domain